MQISRWLLFLAPVLLAGQVVSVDLSPVIQEPGRGIALIELRTQAAGEPAALGWTIDVMGEAAHVQVEPGEQAIGAKKRIDCARTRDQVTCVLWGPNKNVIHDGILAKIVLSENGSRGAEPRLSRIAAASADGGEIVVKGQPDARRAPKQPSTARFLLGCGGSAVMVLAILAVIYARRSRLTAAH